MSGWWPRGVADLLPVMGHFYFPGTATELRGMALDCPATTEASMPNCLGGALGNGHRCLDADLATWQAGMAASDSGRAEAELTPRRNYHCGRGDEGCTCRAVECFDQAGVQSADSEPTCQSRKLEGDESAGGKGLFDVAPSSMLTTRKRNIGPAFVSSPASTSFSIPVAHLST